MGSTPSPPGALRHVELLTPAAFADLKAFYGAWGLEMVEETDDAIAFRALGPNHHVVRFVRADHTGLGHIAFAAGSRQEVEAIQRDWQARGVTVTSEPGPFSSPGGGYGFEAEDPEGRTIRVVAEMQAVDPRASGPALPVRLTHVVLNTVDIDLLCAFYVEVFGFAVSDWSEHQMVFLRNTRDHHSIAFNQAEHASVNHMAFELPSLDAFLTSVGRMKGAGIEPLWGMGRHGPGNNCFAYYGDPAGFVPELTAEVQQVEDDGWIPRVWRRIPSQSDLWHLAGPPSAEFRRVGAGVADPNSRPPRWPGR